MTEKFTLEDLFIRIIPGGVLIGILYFVYGHNLNLEIVKGLDFFYTFLFFTFSFLVGEIIQTIAHELEFLTNVFFKFNKPSEVFLYKNNPVLKNENTRLQAMKFLESDKDKLDGFENTYKKLKWFKKDEELRQKSQNYFWKIYTNVSNESEMKIFNRNYLLTRGITIVSLISIVIFLVEKNMLLAISSIALFLMFLWRTRGMARTLVFKTVLLNLKKK
jgi:hypothetical protein